MRKFLAVLVALALAGCAQLTADKAKIEMTVEQGQKALADFKTEDLKAAIAMGTAASATDPAAQYRVRCYTTLLKHVSDGQTVGQAIPAIKGVASGYELAAELDAKARAGTGASLIPADVHADCAVVVTSINEFLIRIGLIAAGASAGAPGIGAAINGAAGAVPGILNALPKP